MANPTEPGERPTEQDVDPSAMAVHSIDDTTRTHLRDHDETADVERGSGGLRSVEDTDDTDGTEE